MRCSEAGVTEGGKAYPARCGGRGGVDKKPKFKQKMLLAMESQRG